MSRQIEAIRVGARLRGVEATIKGNLEKSGDVIFLRLTGGTERIQITPLTQKVQLDVRGNQRQRATLGERMAFADFQEEWNEHSGPILITGPLVNEDASGKSTLQVRRYSFLTPKQGRIRKLVLGLDVNGPYGIGERWGAIRDGLARLARIKSVEELPDLATATCEVVLHKDQGADLQWLAHAIRELSVGASLRGVEATLDGWLTNESGRAKLRIPDPIGSVELEPLRRKVQWDVGRNMPEPIADDERLACQLPELNQRRSTASCG